MHCLGYQIVKHCGTPDLTWMIGISGSAQKYHGQKEKPTGNAMMYHTINIGYYNACQNIVLVTSISSMGVTIFIWPITHNIKRQ